jgi:hypothetical protein
MLARWGTEMVDNKGSRARERVIAWIDEILKEQRERQAPHAKVDTRSVTHVLNSKQFGEITRRNMGARNGR